MSYSYSPIYSNVTVPNGGTSTAKHTITLSTPYTTGTGLTVGGGNGYSWATSASLAPSSGRIQLNGDDADIVINGQSLNKTLQTIQEALLIPGTLKRDTKLESEFAELKAVAEQYETLLEKYQEQKKVFDILKTQDQ